MGRKWDEIRVGQEIGTWKHVITENEIITLNEAVEDTNPWYLKDAGGANSIAPPMLIADDYLHIAVNAGFELSYCFHTRTEQKFLRLIKIGNCISSTSRIVDKYEKRDREYIVIETLSKDEENNLVAKSKNTLVRVL